MSATDHAESQDKPTQSANTDDQPLDTVGALPVVTNAQHSNALSNDVSNGNLSSNALGNHQSSNNANDKTDNDPNHQTADKQNLPDLQPTDDKSADPQSDSVHSDTKSNKKSDNSKTDDTHSDDNAKNDDVKNNNVKDDKLTPQSNDKPSDVKPSDVKSNNDQSGIANLSNDALIKNKADNEKADGSKPNTAPKTKKAPKVVAVVREAGDTPQKTAQPPNPKKKSPKPKPTPKKGELPFWLSLLVAMLAGLSFVFSLAPYGLWGVAILSPMILYGLLLLADKPVRAFLLGLAYGFGVWASGAFWLYTSIHQYGGVPAWLAVIMIGAMALAMGLFHAIMAWGFVKFLGKQPLAFASVWVVQEWLKTWLFTGFPWLFVGYAFTEVALVSPLAPIVGVLGVGFVVVLFSASLVELLRQKAGYLLIALGMLVCSAMLWLISPTWTTPTGEKLSVSLVQGNIPQDLKWLTEYKQETLEIYAELSQHEWGRDMVVWPEGAVTVFHDEALLVLNDIDRFAKRHNTAFMTGIPYRDLAKFDPENDPYPPFYNSVMALGLGTGVYKKQNLVPFGEYIPFGIADLLPNLANNKDVANHTKGDRTQNPLNIKGKPMGVAICYEVAYPETTRRNAKNSDFLLTVSNDAWFGTSSGPHQHLQMVQMRAMETGRWFARGTNTGVTAIINEKGQIVAKAPQFERTVLRGDVAMMTGRTPYMVWGVYPILLICAVLIGLSAFAGGARGRYFAKDGKYMQDYR